MIIQSIYTNVSIKIDMKQSYFLPLLFVFAIIILPLQMNAQFGTLTLVEPENFEDLEPLLPGVEYTIVLKYDALATQGADIVNPATIDIVIIPSGGVEITSAPELEEDNCTITTKFKPIVNDVAISICADDDDPFTQGSKAIFRTEALSVPVIFSSLYGAQNNKEVKIDWSTQIEVGNELFEIERAFADSGFSPIGSLKGGGNSIRNISYAFSDLNPQSGVNMYRIKQTDFNGESAYSETVRVVYFSEKDIQLSPNPASQSQDSPMLYIYSDQANTVSIQMYNMIGKLMSAQTSAVLEGQNRFALNTSDLYEGVYLVKIKMGDYISTRKLLIEE